MERVHAIRELQQRADAERAAGRRIALVPTMGALHAGHLSLVERAAAVCDRVVVSIFVNPKQFAAGEDLDTYPRDEERDLAALAPYGVSLVYAPAMTATASDVRAPNARPATSASGESERPRVSQPITDTAVIATRT